MSAEYLDALFGLYRSPCNLDKRANLKEDRYFSGGPAQMVLVHCVMAATHIPSALLDAARDIAVAANAIRGAHD